MVQAQCIELFNTVLIPRLRGRRNTRPGYEAKCILELFGYLFHREFLPSQEDRCSDQAEHSVRHFGMVGHIQLQKCKHKSALRVEAKIGSTNHTKLYIVSTFRHIKTASSYRDTQWRSYTRAHTGPGPGEFLSALVNHAKSTYLNRNSVAVYIELCHVE